MPRLGGLLSLARRQVLGQAHVAHVPRPLLRLQPGLRLLSSEPPEHQPESKEPWIPEYIEKFQEPLEEKRSRLMYQSRKRGMLENGLLLGKFIFSLYLNMTSESDSSLCYPGSFAKKFLAEMDEEKLAFYDRLINLPSNDWEIYYWAVEQKETPEEFDNVIMDMLKLHAKNENRESRITMPDLH